MISRGSAGKAMQIGHKIYTFFYGTDYGTNRAIFGKFTWERMDVHMLRPFSHLVFTGSGSHLGNIFSSFYFEITFIGTINICHFPILYV